MYEVDMFPSRFFIIEDSIKHEELMRVLNTIKKDTENLVKVTSGKQGPTYKTNHPQAEVHGELFNPIIEQLNKKLVKDNVSFELLAAPWYAEYGEYDFHEPHVHHETCIISEIPNSFRYSGIICLSNFGGTGFVNPNSSYFDREATIISSKYNRVILFPSNIYHYVIPHGFRDQTRAIFSFNCELKLGSFNANI